MFLCNDLGSYVFVENWANVAVLPQSRNGMAVKKLCDWLGSRVRDKKAAILCHTTKKNPGQRKPTRIFLVVKRSAPAFRDTPQVKSMLLHLYHLPRRRVRRSLQRVVQHTACFQQRTIQHHRVVPLRIVTFLRKHHATSGIIHR